MSREVSINTIMVGPEGAGKTVLAAVLAEYVNRHPDLGLQVRPADFETKKYYQDVISTLQSGEWPKSTRQGDVQSLAWQWGTSGAWYPAVLQDPAGQDIRDELTGKTSTLGIVQRIKAANLLILVVDVVGHQRATLEQRQQNAWIVEHVLQLVDPERTSVIVAVTKADQLTHAIPQDQIANKEAVLRVIMKMMPEFSLNAYRKTLDHTRCAALAVAAVVAELDYGPDGEQRPVPSHDLHQMGLANLVQQIVDAIRTQREMVNAVGRDEEDERRRKKLEWWAKRGAAVLIAALALYMAIPPVGEFMKELMRKPEVITVVVTETYGPCDECGGDGIDGVWPFDEVCKPCKGNGTVLKAKTR